MSDESQILLDLPVEEARSRADLVEGASNRTAVELIDSWPDWPGAVVVLAGPTGSGKSHFAEIWALESEALFVSATSLSAATEALSNGRNLVIEDAAAGTIEETGLFHLINLARENGTFILITSRFWPSQWNVKLKDLESRLRAAVLVELGEPDDMLLKQVLMKHFADRQVTVAPDVIDYLVARMERSLSSAATIADQLDKAALAKRSAITKPLAKQVLQKIQDPA